MCFSNIRELFIQIDLLKQTNDDTALRPAVPGVSNENIMEASVLMNSIVKLVQVLNWS